MHTDIQYQSFSRGFWGVDTEGSHARDDWTDEVNVEDGEEVDDVEDDGQGEEAHAPETRHDRWESELKGVWCLWYAKTHHELFTKLSSRCFLNFA